LVPGLTQGAAIGNYVAQIHVGATRKYFYKLEGANEDRDYYTLTDDTIVSPS